MSTVVRNTRRITVQQRAARGPTGGTISQAAIQALIDEGDALRLAKASNLSDVASATAARNNLGAASASDILAVEADLSAAVEAIQIVGEEAGLTAELRDGEVWLTDSDQYSFPLGVVNDSDYIGDRHYAWLDARMHHRSDVLRSIPVSGFAPYGLGGNVVLGVGQSLMAGDDTSNRLELVPERQLSGLVWSAKMIGESERCKRTRAEFEYYGTLELNSLVETAVSNSNADSAVLSQADVAAGNYTTSARGATAIPAACLTFEWLWRAHAQTDAVDATRYDIAVNVAKGEAWLDDISTGDSLLRLYDGMLKAKQAKEVTAAGDPIRLSAVLDRHGQADESLANTDYRAVHRSFRDTVNANAASEYGQSLRAPWIATQVSGYYGRPHRVVANQMLAMALDKGVGALDYDYFIATPDYPFPNFANTAEPFPTPGNGHPTTMAQQMAGEYMAWCRFYVQVLGRNWFPTHMVEAYYSGDTIIVGFAAMQPPLSTSPVCVSLTMETLAALGFDVEDEGSDVEILSVEQVGDLTFKIVVDKAALVAPTVGTAKGNRGTWPEFAGATNIHDSQTLWTLFEKVFEDGYTNIYAGGYVDTADTENITELLGKQPMYNWAVSQSLTCQPLPRI